MGRTYAGILGPLAFTVVILRSLLDGGSVESTIQIACLGLFAFAGIGYVTGRLADWIISESVRARFDAELKAQEEARSAERAPGAP